MRAPCRARPRRAAPPAARSQLLRWSPRRQQAPTRARTTAAVGPRHGGGGRPVPGGGGGGGGRGMPATRPRSHRSDDSYESATGASAVSGGGPSLSAAAAAASALSSGGGSSSPSILSPPSPVSTGSPLDAPDDELVALAGSALSTVKETLRRTSTPTQPLERTWTMILYSPGVVGASNSSSHATVGASSAQPSGCRPTSELCEISSPGWYLVLGFVLIDSAITHQPSRASSPSRSVAL
mmetsp:Transcript_25442/g.67140  ORF Transcript_25442/g.67140 Transcript_25442/m.67140 type:complete len:239 (-) Transcript_25442:1041-1757(-)